MSTKAIDRLGAASAVVFAVSVFLGILAPWLPGLLIPALAGFGVFLIMFVSYGVLADPGRRR